MDFECRWLIFEAIIGSPSKEVRGNAALDNLLGTHVRYFIGDLKKKFFLKTF
jgi:hypothetical protein